MAFFFKTSKAKLRFDRGGVPALLKHEKYTGDDSNLMKYRPSVGTGATGANAPVNFEQWVPGTRPEIIMASVCMYFK